MKSTLSRQPPPGTLVAMDFNDFPPGPAGMFAHLANFAGMQQQPMRRPDPKSYDDYFRAYSMAILGKERENVSYGGKIIMPPSALARLTQLDLESPWMFKLSNPSNPAASTHAGVLEFIAEEGIVHLPHWMMQSLRLNEGDPIRVTGTELPKGKFVKLQAQTVHFLEISDPKAVLEQALRHFSALTQGDIIEISYNSIVFGLLVMETKPGGEGISVLDTDLEVDFAAPVGYVEPERPKPAPPTTMADKLGIDVNSSTPGSSRPSSAIGFVSQKAGLSKAGEQWESFKGKGQTLNGRKTKGKGISHRKAEEVAQSSKIWRTGKARVVTNNSLEGDVTAPAPLNLPFGKLFFGYNIPPYTPPTPSSPKPGSPPSSFSGVGTTLTGRSTGTSSAKGKEKETSPQQPSASWGSGGRTRRFVGPSNAASFSGRAVGAGGAPVPILRRRAEDSRSRSPTPELEDYYDDDEMIDIDDD
ncbi:hypothetical protein NM688_g3091 [Phlebia brevispora]|uniref:Uncharacterized protein n=1 Tax=Phlebia brevispora TaxID=194682 RepID=A0ACC1T6V8_9APHY|nr:hypothetical protein NM688_g3091 [Phlebia brevispora]